MAVLLAGASASPPPQADPTPLGVPFQRYTVQDSFGRTITFYLSVPTRNEKDAKQPVTLFIQGSGCQSLFRKRGERIAGGYQNPLRQEAQGRVRVLIVEKPGVKFLDAPARPGSAEGASEEFLKEHTLPRWAEANAAALRAVWTLPGIDASRTLVIGHSEGGLVAARIAAETPQVTHVASLAGGGPTQLFDLAEIRGRPRPYDRPGDAEGRVREVYQEWAKIQKDPEAISKFWLGHPYRRWSSFLEHSVTEELLRTKAKIYLAQGAADDSVSVKAHDVLVAELRARGRDVTAERLDGADHGFRTPEMPKGSPDGMQGLLRRILEWFLTEDTPRPAARRSLSPLVQATMSGQTIDKAEKDACRTFPDPQGKGVASRPKRRLDRMALPLLGLVRPRAHARRLVQTALGELERRIARALEGESPYRPHGKVLCTVAYDTGIIGA